MAISIFCFNGVVISCLILVGDYSFDMISVQIKQRGHFYDYNIQHIMMTFYHFVLNRHVYPYDVITIVCL